MNTQDILKLIYETKDLNKFKKVFISYCEKNNIDYKIVPVIDGASKQNQSLTIKWISKHKRNLYIIGYRAIFNHQFYIDDETQKRFYERKTKKENNGFSVSEEITLDPYYKFMEDNKELLEYLKDEYTKSKKRKEK